MVQLVKSRLKVVDGNPEYQGVAIPEFDTALQVCSRHVIEDLRCLDQKIKSRLDWSDTDLLRAIVAFIDTQSWVEREASDDEHAIVDPDVISNDTRQIVEYIIGVFRVPLEAKGFSVKAIQLEEVVAYARRYLPICTESYKKIWYKLHTCPDAGKWPHTLCQSIFSLPFSTSRFSLS